MFVGSQLREEKRGQRVTALISCSLHVIYKEDLAPWHARTGDMGVYVCEWAGAQVLVCASAYR